jgi:MFS family permease
VIAFCILIGEGAMADWSAVYLSRFTGQGMAATGYSVFSFTMAAGRLSGDWLRARLGSVMMVRAGSALAAIGLGGALAAGSMIPALIGFACAGAGWASIFPILSGAAGHKSPSQPEAGVAAVSATGFFAFLVGPPLIGFIAQAWTLRIGLGVVVVLSAVAAMLAYVVRDADVGLKAG